LRNNYGSVAWRAADGRLPVTRYGLEDFAVTGGAFENEPWASSTWRAELATTASGLHRPRRHQPQLGRSPVDHLHPAREADQTNLTLDWTATSPTPDCSSR
jgi:iron complex outermembrane receptor protein